MNLTLLKNLNNGLIDSDQNKQSSMKKILSLLGLAAVLGTASASASSITLNISGQNGDNAYKDIIASIGGPAPYGAEVTITSNTFEYTEGLSLYIAPASGYKIISFNSPTEGVIEGNAQQGSVGNWSQGSTDVSAYYNIQLTSSDSNATFNITVIEDENSGNPEVTYPYYIPVVYNDNSVVASATFNTEPVTDKGIEITQSTRGDYGTLVVNLTSGTVLKGVSAYYTIEDGSETSLYADTSEPGSVTIQGIPYETAKTVYVDFTLQKSADNSVILSFTGMANAYQNVAVYDAPTGGKATQVNITEDPFTYKYPSTSGFIFIKPTGTNKINEINSVDYSQTQVPYTFIQIDSEVLASNLGNEYGISLTIGDWYFAYNSEIESEVTVIVTLATPTEGPGESTYIPVTYSNPQAVASATFNGFEVTSKGIEINSNIHGGTGNLVIALVDGALVNGAVATYTSSETTERVDLNGVYYTEATNDKPATITVPNIPYEIASAVNVTFTYDAPQVNENIQVTFFLYAMGLANPASSYVKSVIVDDNPVDLTGNSFSVKYYNTQAVVVITLEEGYTVSNYRSSSDMKFNYELLDNIVTFTLDADAANADGQIEIMIGELNITEVPVVFEVEEYPGLISFLSWNNVSTEVSDDAELEDYEVAFKPSMTEGTLTIVFSKDANNNLVYLVSEVNVSIDGSFAEATITEDTTMATVTIPATAKEVIISFVATENPTSGIDSIFGENGDNAIYNLNGVRVNGNNLSKGIYIINGKKVVVK